MTGAFVGSTVRPEVNLPYGVRPQFIIRLIKESKIIITSMGPVSHSLNIAGWRRNQKQVLPVSSPGLGREQTDPRTSGGPMGVVGGCS